MTVFFAAAQQMEEWRPPVDVYRTRWGWILKFDIAGVRLEDIQVHIARQAVTVSGIRRDCLHEDDCRFYSMEIAYNRFQRTVELPDQLEGAQLKLDYRDGLLIIRVQTKESNR